MKYEINHESCEILDIGRQYKKLEEIYGYKKIN